VYLGTEIHVNGLDPAVLEPDELPTAPPRDVTLHSPEKRVFTGCFARASVLAFCVVCKGKDIVRPEQAPFIFSALDRVRTDLTFISRTSAKIPHFSS